MLSKATKRIQEVQPGTSNLASAHHKFVPTPPRSAGPEAAATALAQRIGSHHGGVHRSSSTLLADEDSGYLASHNHRFAL